MIDRRALSVLCADRPDLFEALSSLADATDGGEKTGEGAELASLLDDFVDETRQVASDAENGIGGREYVLARRRLGAWQQTDKGTKEVLDEHLACVPSQLASLLKEACGSQPDWDEVSGQVVAFEHDGSDTWLVAYFEADGDTAQVWGGPVGELEVRRVATIRVNHARWRDRRSRRLVRVIVEADERWADPEPFLARVRHVVAAD